jgi:hypothetical protein
MSSLIGRVGAGIRNWIENDQAYNLALLEGLHETYGHDCIGAQE